MHSGRACVGLVLRRGSMSFGQLEKKIITRGAAVWLEIGFGLGSFFFFKIAPSFV